MIKKTAAVAGGGLGWGGAITLVFIDSGHAIVLAQAALLSLGIISSAWMMLSCRSRPMNAAFEMGYEMGRRDAVKEHNRNVSPIRRAPGGLTEFNRAMASK